MEDRKIIVLDDDPTGIQTVHDVYVYTDWSLESIRDGFDSSEQMFFILTNSRSLTSEETTRIHKDIVANIVAVSKETGKKYVLISRSDSTLRGHYPLETEILRDEIEKLSNVKIDAEILCPFFPEGGRYTAGNIHYVAEGTKLVPAGKTEFANDRTFGYKSSDLREFIEEKSKGAFKKEDVVCFSLEELRAGDKKALEEKLDSVINFKKVVVNAIEYSDLKAFCEAVKSCIERGRNYIFRSAAAVPKVLADIEDRSLLSADELREKDNKNGGLIVIGSHVAKTTRQLNELEKAKDIFFLELDVTKAIDEKKFEEELERVKALVNEKLSKGINIALYTTRKRIDLNTGNREDDLKLSVRISNAVTSIVSDLKVMPSFLIAKGGITSSDIGTKGLLVKKALVLGQILPGIPVWKTGEESKFPNMSYVIFPGNVGSDTALYEALQIISNY